MSIIKTMVEDLDFVIKHAKGHLEDNNAHSPEIQATMLEAIRNATYTKASIIQAMDKITNILLGKLDEAVNKEKGPESED